MKQSNTAKEKFAKARQNLEKIEEKKIDEVNSFLELLISQQNKPRNTDALQGVWEDLDFEKEISLEEEIRTLRKESSERTLNKFSQ